MKSEIITYEEPKSPISEIFRTLRTNIQYMNIKKGLKSILITSTSPSEGKSWISANLAVTFAQAGKKVVLVNADMRKGRQFSIFGISPTPGLSNYLSGINSDGRDSSTDIFTYIQRTEVENLYMLAAGNVPPNPSELLVTDQMEELIKILTNAFDLIIFDGTPSDLVTNAVIISRYVDTTLIVTSYKETKMDGLEKIKKNIENVGGKIAGVVINKMPISTKDYYYSYYYGSNGKKKKKKKKMSKKEQKKEMEEFEIAMRKKQTKDKLKRMLRQNKEDYDPLTEQKIVEDEEELDEENALNSIENNIQNDDMQEELEITYERFDDEEENNTQNTTENVAEEDVTEENVENYEEQEEIEQNNETQEKYEEQENIEENTETDIELQDEIEENFENNEEIETQEENFEDQEQNSNEEIVDETIDEENETIDEIKDFENQEMDKKQEEVEETPIELEEQEETLAEQVSAESIEEQLDTETVEEQEENIAEAPQEEIENEGLAMLKELVEEGNEEEQIPEDVYNKNIETHFEESNYQERHNEEKTVEPQTEQQKSQFAKEQISKYIMAGWGSNYNSEEDDDDEQIIEEQFADEAEENQTEQTAVIGNIPEAISNIDNNAENQTQVNFINEGQIETQEEVAYENAEGLIEQEAIEDYKEIPQEIIQETAEEIIQEIPQVISQEIPQEIPQEAQNYEPIIPQQKANVYAFYNYDAIKPTMMNFNHNYNNDEIEQEEVIEDHKEEGQNPEEFI